MGAAALPPAPAPPASAIGRRVGPYQIQSLLGAGAWAKSTSPPTRGSAATSRSSSCPRHSPRTGSGCGASSARRAPPRRSTTRTSSPSTRSGRPTARTSSPPSSSRGRRCASGSQAAGPRPARGARDRHAGGRARWRRRTRPGSSTATSSPRTSWCGPTGWSKSSTSGSPSSPSAGAAGTRSRRGCQAQTDPGTVMGTVDLHVAGAGARAHGRRAHRHLQPRRRPLRDGEREKTL